MRPEMLTALSALAVAVVTAIGGIVQVVIGRRQPRPGRGADRRDDFTTIVKELRTSLTEVKAELADQKTASEQDRERIKAQDYALRYIAGWARSLVAYMRQAQLEPPPPPQPVPDEVRPYLHDIGT